MHLAFPYQGRRLPAFSSFQWLMLVLAACVIAVLSLGAHDLAIAHLGVPYPDESTVPGWAKFSGQFLRIAATVWFCRLAGWYLDRHSAVTAALLVGSIVMCFHETFRIIAVDNWLVEGWVGHRWVYMVAQRLPTACMTFFWGAAAAMTARRLAGKHLFTIAAAVLATTALSYFAVQPGIRAACSAAVQALHLAEPPELYQMPYGWHVYQVIYGAFIEPAIAMFLITWLAWPALQGSPARRIAMLAVITLMMRGRVIATFFFCFWLRLPLGSAMAAEGQFFVETLILAVCTGCAWNTLLKRPAASEH